ncbi:hypothetical protein ACHWQZ_G015512 [Mnemiopsis leidyi]
MNKAVTTTLLVLSSLTLSASLTCYFCERWTLNRTETMSERPSCLDPEQAVNCAAGDKCVEGNSIHKYEGSPDLHHNEYYKGCDKPCAEKYAVPGVYSQYSCNEKVCDSGDLCNDMSLEDARVYRRSGQERVMESDGPLKCHYCEKTLSNGITLVETTDCLNPESAVLCSSGDVCVEGNSVHKYNGYPDKYVQEYYKGCAKPCVERTRDQEVYSEITCHDKSCDTNLCNKMTMEEARRYPNTESDDGTSADGDNGAGSFGETGTDEAGIVENFNYNVDGEQAEIDSNLNRDNLDGVQESQDGDDVAVKIDSGEDMSDDETETSGKLERDESQKEESNPADSADSPEYTIEENIEDNTVEGEEEETVDDNEYETVDVSEVTDTNGDIRVGLCSMFLVLPVLFSVVSVHE